MKKAAKSAQTLKRWNRDQMTDEKETAGSLLAKLITADESQEAELAEKFREACGEQLPGIEVEMSGFNKAGEMSEESKTGTPVPITVDLLPDNRMYFRNDWISGSLGDVEFAINQVMNGPVVHIKYGSQNFTLDLSQVIEAMPSVLATKSD